MLIITALITVIVIVMFSLAIGFVAQYRWIKKQRAKYGVLHAKKLAGNIKHLELCWLNAAEDHKYKSFGAYVRCQRNKYAGMVKRRVEDFMQAWREFRENIREPKDTVKHIHPGPQFPTAATQGEWSATRKDEPWRALDTDKLREDAMCFDSGGYNSEAEEKRTGKKCDIPFSVGPKTEVEIQAEELLKNESKDL